MYNHFAGNKDEFCEWWCKCNKERVAEAKAKIKADEERWAVKDKVLEILLRLDKKVSWRNDWQPSTKFLGERMKNFLRKQHISFGDDVMIMTVISQLNKIVRTM